MNVSPDECVSPELLRMQDAAKALSPVGMPDLALYGSFGRPRALLDWFHDHFGEGGRSLDVLTDLEARGPYARAFWATVSQWWSAMDGINHAEMAEAFDMFSEHWDTSLLASDDCARAWRYLPRKRPVTIYRGQSADDPVGLCWTRDRAKAEWFARTGLRMVGRPARPAILTTTILKLDVALAFNGRNEKEIVPFAIPETYTVELLA